jgi:protein-disulfide isomerase
MALEQADTTAKAEAQRAAIAAQAAALFRNPDDPVKGNAQGAVTIVEFFDARCGYCKQMEPVVDQMLHRQKDVRLVMKDLPILGPNSLLASRALLAAQRQGKYAELHDALMKLREEPAEPVLKREAERLGLDWAKLRRDMDDPAVGRRLEANTRLASALRIEGTPALIIGDTLVPGAVDLATLERLVAEAREKRGG